MKQEQFKPTRPTRFPFLSMAKYLPVFIPRIAIIPGLIDVKLKTAAKQESKMMYLKQMENKKLASYFATLFYKNNFIRTRGSFLLKISAEIKNNPSLSRRTKSQILN